MPTFVCKLPATFMDRLPANALLTSLPPVWRQANLQLQTLHEGQQWPLSTHEAWFPTTALLGLYVGAGPQGLPPLVGCNGWLPPAEQVDSPLQVCVLRTGEAYRCDWSWAGSGSAMEAAVWMACAGATEALHQQWARRAFSHRHHDPVQALASWWWDGEQAARSGEPLVWREAHLLEWLGCLPSVLSRALWALREQGALEPQGSGWCCADPVRLAAVAGQAQPSLATQASASASATLMPSTPADRIPPA